MVRLVMTVVATLLYAGLAPSQAAAQRATFDELVSSADVIFVGEVVDVRAFPVARREGQLIKTRVTFRVSDALFGASSITEALEFLGGEWGGEGMAVSGMPKLTVGDRRVVFARRTSGINPIVGFTDGLLQVSRDVGGVDRILTLGGFPIAAPESIGVAGVGMSAQPIMPMTLADFRDRVWRAVVAQGRR